MDKLSIGQMAELNQLSVQTLRFYDKIGLLKPDHVDKESSYRYYNIKQSAKLDMIQYLKSMGMPLEKIKDQFEKEDVRFVQEKLIEQNKWLETKIKEFRTMKNAVESCLNNYSRYIQSPKDSSIEIQHIPERKVFCYNGKIDIYQNNLSTYEYILRQLKKQVMLRHLPMTYFCNVGSILRKEKIDKNQFVSTEIFVFVDDESEFKNQIEIIPENDFICIHCDSFWKEKEHADILFRHIKEKGYKICGDYICEVVVELPVFYENERNMFIRLQIPIKTS